jgi:hypothetical protein
MRPSRRSGPPAAVQLTTRYLGFVATVRSIEDPDRNAGSRTVPWLCQTIVSSRRSEPGWSGQQLWAVVEPMPGSENELL